MRFDVLIATVDDLELLVRHRLRMFDDVFPELIDKVNASEGETLKWIKNKMSENELVGFIARTSDGKVGGSGCLWIRETQPRPTSPLLKEPYLLSMFVEKAFRRKGVARLIVQSAIAWARERGYNGITLHASDAGSPPYESLGFEPTNEVRLKW